MKNYRIRTIRRTINGVEYLYTFNNGGYYQCNELNERRVESDFCCLPNCEITSIQSTNGAIYNLNDRRLDNGGVITQFQLNNKKAFALINGDWVNTHNLAIERPTLTPPIINANILNNETTENIMATTVKKAAAINPAAPTAPSRSQLKKDNPFQKVQDVIEKQKDIRLEKFLKKNLPKTLKEFLVQFFLKYNQEKNTIYVDTKMVQTTPGRRRSMGDLYKICKYYYPETTLYDLVVLLFRDLKQTKELKSGFRYSYCNTVNRRVFYYAHNNGILEQDSTDEFGNNPKFYISKI